MARTATLRRLVLAAAVGAVAVVGTVAAAGVDGAADPVDERAVRLDAPDIDALGFDVGAVES